MSEDPPPHSELASFGDELRREREIRGISLKEIADSTKISRRFLEAIERNDHKTLPAPVFTRGFVREYARYLGLNADDMVNRYNYAAVGDDRIEQSDHLQRLTTPPTPLPGGKPRPAKGIPHARVDRNLVILAVIVVALAGISFWALKHRARRDAEAIHPVESTAVAAPAPQRAAPAAPAATTSSAAPAPAADTLRLVVDVSGRSWVVLEADGHTVFNEEMRRGEHHTFEAKERLRFRTVGNAGGLSLTLNDVRLPPLGGEGDVVHDRVYDRATLQQLSNHP
jgi:cytoskeleton protein RodZ